MFYMFSIVMFVYWRVSCVSHSRVDMKTATRRVTMAASTASMDGEAKVSPLMAAVRSPGTQPSHGDFLVQINDFKQLDFK